MSTFLLRRLVVLCLTLLLVSLLAFLVPHLSAADPVRAIIRSRVADLAVDSEALAALRVQLGLDRPLWVQFLAWLGDALRGDFGYSYTSRTPVFELIGAALAVSAILAGSALALALLVALPLGVVSALRPGRAVDNGVTFLTQSFVAMPEYWLAPMGILLFAVHLGWLPSAGWREPASVVLPALVLALRPLAYFARVTRAAMIDVLQAPYIVAARSRGLGMAETVLRHGLRNGILPVITLFAMWLAGLLGGSVVIEVIFAIPGMGRLTYEAVVNNDIPVLQGGIVAIVGLAIAINTAADLLYVALNPAIRLGDGRA
jgi:peptide/nickel transport system permease protein